MLYVRTLHGISRWGCNLFRWSVRLSGPFFCILFYKLLIFFYLRIVWLADCIADNYFAIGLIDYTQFLKFLLNLKLFQKWYWNNTIAHEKRSPAKPSFSPSLSASLSLHYLVSTFTLLSTTISRPRTCGKLFTGFELINHFLVNIPGCLFHVPFRFLLIVLVFQYIYFDTIYCPSNIE